MLIFILIVVIFIFFLIWYKKIEFEILKEEGLKWYYLIFLFIMVLLVLVVGNLVYYLVDIGSFYV